MIKVRIDPGHDSAACNPSPVVPEYCEGQQMWILSNLLKAELERYEGVQADLTKQQVNEAITVTRRGRMGEGYDFLISMHSNACDTESVDRAVAIYQLDNETSRALAVLLSEAVAQVMGVDAQQYDRKSNKDRDGNGELDDNYYGVLHGAAQVGTPAVIAEHSFHTNAAAAEWLMSGENLEKLAKAEARTLAEYYHLKPKPVFSDVPEDAWYARAVHDCAARGLLVGDGDGRFRPDAPITRAELAAALCRLM